MILLMLFSAVFKTVCCCKTMVNLASDTFQVHSMLNIILAAAVSYATNQRVTNLLVGLLFQSYVQGWFRRLAVNGSCCVRLV